MSKLLDIVNSPWAIQPDKLREIRAIYETHMKGEKIDLDAVRSQTGLPLQNKPQGYDVVDGVAIIPIHGVIAKRMNMFAAISGGASSELVGRDIQAALADSSVHSIILHIDSPGGTVDGTPSLADIIRDAGEVKTVVAFADGLMASAAYWIGSAASSIYIDGPTTQVGSIGVVASHVDISQAQAKEGIKTTEISSGKYKRIASGYAPLSEEGRQSIQDQTDYLYSVFVEVVAVNRGVSVEAVLKNMADGKTFIGQQAIDAGLVDGVSTLDSLIASLAAGSNPLSKPAGAAGSHSITIDEGNHMSITKDFVAKNHPDIAEAFRAEGYSQGRSEGVNDGATRERERILALDALPARGHEALVATFKADGKTTAPEAALQVLAAEHAKGNKMLAALAADAPNAVPAATEPGTAAPAGDDSLPVEDRCKATWEKDSKIRAEFGTFDTYLAFEKASSQGRVSILSKRA
ncbi:signal peptide peptidase SppA [Nitrosospira sp. Nsp2]|uniref:S49 family peptidase n=1 Tax=Nitrosospira sp. Nsp2 TaxID=136548 RepID=UPI000D3249DD|nr:S49 family peptidase [Nitrosospira sp. Nsp2]PTR17494.1 signal peptide peptidase SppA [Nitrosospira sp. Nsp2]